jgi:hypothetical protein
MAGGTGRESPLGKSLILYLIGSTLFVRGHISVEEEFLYLFLTPQNKFKQILIVKNNTTAGGWSVFFCCANLFFIYTE